MASPNAARAVSAAAGDDPRKHDLAGELLGPEHSINLPERQAEHLRRRFLLSAPIARAVAEIHFGWAA
jgi:hypothetical protein